MHELKNPLAAVKMGVPTVLNRAGLQKRDRDCLDLAIVHRLVDAHSGECSIQSRVRNDAHGQRGTVVKISFPRIAGRKAGRHSNHSA